MLTDLLHVNDLRIDYIRVLVLSFFLSLEWCTKFYSFSFSNLLVALLLSVGWANHEVRFCTKARKASALSCEGRKPPLH